MKAKPHLILQHFPNLNQRIADKLGDPASPSPLLVAFGDSVTQGWMGEEELRPACAFPALILAGLQSQVPSCSFNLINAGVGGETVTKAADRLDRDVLSHQPDLVIVGFGLNDSAAGHAGVAAFTEQLRLTVRAIRETGADLLLMTPNMMCHELTARIAPKWKPSAPKLRERQIHGVLAAYSEAICRVGKEERVPVADVYAQWKRLRATGVDTDAMLANGLNHPGPKGHEIAAETALNLLVDSGATRPPRDDSPGPQRTGTKEEKNAQRKAARTARQQDPRPNILWFFTDQQTWDALGCARRREVFTPNMDRLARRGVRFETHYCAAPVCGPARAALVTGRWPHQNGVRFNGETPSESTPTIGEVFRDAGYETYWSGKWHLPQSYVKTEEGVRGFANRPLPDGLNGGGFGEATDMLFAQDAARQLRYELNLSARPWLYTISLHNPHDICHWCADPPELEGMKGLPPLPTNHAIPPAEPAMLAARRIDPKYGKQLPGVQDWSEQQWRGYLRAYNSMTEAVDRCLGIVLDALEAGGWNENTVVIFSSDHGEGMAERKWVTKLSLYEPVARVPLIISWPGRIREGNVDRASLTSALDLFPTMCDIAGITPPENLAGTSLLDAAKTGERLQREAVFACLANDPQDATSQARMVRTDRYKYIVYGRGNHAEELFDLCKDPGETHNLVHHPDHAEARESHRALMASWLEEVHDDKFRSAAMASGREPAMTDSLPSGNVGL